MYLVSLVLQNLIRYTIILNSVHTIRFTNILIMNTWTLHLTSFTLSASIMQDGNIVKSKSLHQTDQSNSDKNTKPIRDAINIRIKSDKVNDIIKHCRFSTCE